MSNSAEREKPWRSQLAEFQKPEKLGIAGLLQCAKIFNKIDRDSKDDLQEFCDAANVRGLEASFFGSAGKRLFELHGILGNEQVEAFALLRIVMESEEEFQMSLAAARRLQNKQTIAILDDITEAIDAELVPNSDGSPLEIFGIKFTSKPFPSEAEIRGRAHELWARAGRPIGEEQAFYYQAERELLNDAIQTRSQGDEASDG